MRNPRMNHYSIIFPLILFLTACSLTDKPTESLARESHLSHLKNIGFYILVYSYHNNGFLPADLGDLMVDKEYGTTYGKFFVCHGVSSTRIPSNANDIRNGLCDYLYFGNSNIKLIDYPQEIPIIISKKGIYSDGTVLVLYSNGYVNEVNLASDLFTIYQRISVSDPNGVGEHQVPDDAED